MKTKQDYLDEFQNVGRATLWRGARYGEFKITAQDDCGRPMQLSVEELPNGNRRITLCVANAVGQVLLDVRVRAKDVVDTLVRLHERGIIDLTDADKEWADATAYAVITRVGFLLFFIVAAVVVGLILKACLG